MLFTSSHQTRTTSFECPLAPNTNSYTSNSFNHSLNKHFFFSHLELACFVYSAKLHPIPARHRKDKPCDYKSFNYCCPSELSDPETPHLAAEWRPLDTWPPSLILSSLCGWRLHTAVSGRYPAMSDTPSPIVLYKYRPIVLSNAATSWPHLFLARP